MPNIPPSRNNANIQKHIRRRYASGFSSNFTNVEASIVARLFGDAGVPGQVVNTRGEVQAPAVDSVAKIIKYLRGQERDVAHFRRAGFEAEAHEREQRLLATRLAFGAFLGTPEVDKAARAHPTIAMLVGDNRASLEKLEKGAVGKRSRFSYIKSPDERELDDRLRIARSRKRIGVPLTEEERTVFRRDRDALAQRIEEVTKRFELASDPDERRALGLEGTSLSNQYVEVKNVLGENAKENKTALEKTINAVTSLMGILSVSTVATRVALTDPFRFQTMPAIGAIGQQGEVGALLAQGLQTQEQYKLSWNQMAMGAGISTMASGIGGLAGAFGTPGGARMSGSGLGSSVGSLVTGGLLTMLGGTGGMAGLLQSMKLAKTDQEIMGATIGQALLDPSRQMGLFQTARPGLLAMGAGGAQDLGFLYNEDAAARMGSSTGNRFLDQIFYGGGGALTGASGASFSQGDQLRRLGFDSNRFAEFLSTAALSLSGRNAPVSSQTVQAARVAGGFGISESAALNLFTLAQGAGVSNPLAAVNRAVGAGAVGGDATPFTVTAITTAILSATQSLKLQNIARNSDELASQVANLGNMMFNSDTPLGDILKDNPQEFMKLVNSLSAGAKMSLENPSLMAFDLSLGTSLEDIITGNPNVVMSRLQFGLNAPGVQGVDFSDMGAVTGNMSALTMMMMMKQFTGINDIQTLGSLLNMVREGKSWDSKEVSDLMEQAGAESIDAKVLAVVDSKVGTLTASFAAQVDAMNLATATVMYATQRISTELLEYMNTDKFLKDAQLGIDKIMEMISKLLSPSEKGNIFKQVLGLGGTPNYQAVTEEHLSSLTDFGRTAELASAQARLNSWWSAYGWEGKAPTLTMEQLPAFLNDQQGFMAMLRQSANTSSGGRATGGYTGTGNALQGVDFVHGGEFVISSQHVERNRQLLERIQSGEDMSGLQGSSVTNSGDSVTLTMRFSGLSEDQIRQLSTKAIEDYVVRHRLNY